MRWYTGEGPIAADEDGETDLVVRDPETGRMTRAERDSTPAESARPSIVFGARDADRMRIAATWRPAARLPPVGEVGAR